MSIIFVRSCLKDMFKIMMDRHAQMYNYRKIISGDTVYCKCGNRPYGRRAGRLN